MAEDARGLVTHPIGDKEETWHQRFRFVEAERWSQSLPLPPVNIPFCPNQASIEQKRLHLAIDGGLDPRVAGVEDLEDRPGVGNPQAVLLSRASLVNIVVRKEYMQGFKGSRTPRGPFQRTILPYVAR